MLNDAIIGPDVYAWVGLSTETKPTNQLEGVRAIETDTNDLYQWYGNRATGSWVLTHKAGQRLIDSTGGLDVNLQDQTSRPVIAYFNEVQNSTTLSVNAVKGAYTITVTNTAGFIAGRYIILFHPASENFSFYRQLGAPVGNVVTLDTPLDYAYPSGTFVDTTIDNMNVDGSGTPRVFGLRGTGAPPGVDVTMDVTRIMMGCITDTAVDLTKFGDIVGGITRGLVFRKRDGAIQNIFNVKTNGEIASMAFDFEVASKSNPVQGQDGFTIRLTFAGQNKIGVALRLPVGEDAEFLVQDDLTDLLSLRVIAEGHLVVD